ncbi:MAG: ABC transporter permease [Gemmatimonadota bacterium]|jgi:ribose transport system permease protein|nr:ABC transporter permease [Gemmatimonadota bacterium]
MLRTLLNSQQAGLLFVILLIGTILSLSAGDHVNRVTGEVVNNFLNSYTLMQTATDASFFVIMAVGATVVIISGGIDLSVGAVYALAGVMTAMMLRAIGPESPFVAVVLALGMCVGIGVLCGLINGAMVVGLRVHPFIVTLGTMWIFRGVAFVTSKAESILVPPSLTDVVKWSIGGDALYPMPMIIMLIITAAGAIYLSRTVMGRHIFAVGGNVDASRYAGLRINRILIGVYILSGLTAGIAAFVGISYYGSASCADATGYELYVIASAVVGGASLRGGRGNAVNAMLGATLIVLIRQSIRTLHLDQNYEWIIIGCAIIVAVVLDQMNQHFTTRRLAKEA